MNRIATSRVALAGVVGLDGQPCDVWPDVAAEEVAEPVAFGQPGHHAVETVLEAADLGLLVHVDGLPQLAALDPGHRMDDVVDRIGYRPGHQDECAPPEGQRHHGDHDDGYHDRGRCRDEPPVGMRDDQEGDEEAGEGAVDEPHHHQPGDHAGCGLAAGELLVRCGDDRPVDPLGEQQTGADARRAAEQHGDHDHHGRTQAALNVRGDHDRAADRPRREQEEGLAPDHVGRGALLRRARFRARDEPPQRRADVPVGAHDGHDGCRHDEADQDREVGLRQQRPGRTGGLVAQRDRDGGDFRGRDELREGQPERVPKGEAVRRRALSLSPRVRHVVVPVWWPS